LAGRGQVVRVGRAVACGYLDDLEAESARVRLHDLAHLRVRRSVTTIFERPSRASR
jgi:hypothetical protein